MPSELFMAVPAVPTRILTGIILPTETLADVGEKVKLAASATEELHKKDNKKTRLTPGRIKTGFIFFKSSVIILLNSNRY
ncbi:MAG: hypothetical protein WCO30_02830 [bacterium]